MIISRLNPFEADNLKVKFTLQGLSEKGREKYDLISIQIPKDKPFILNESVHIVDTKLYIASSKRVILFNDFIYILGLEFEDICGIIDAYVITDASYCHIERFEHENFFNDFISSPIINDIYLYSNSNEYE